MKKKILIVSAFSLLIALLLLAITSNSSNPIITKLSRLSGVTSDNILINSDFKEGFKGWKHDKNITLIETNGINSVCIENSGKGQKRIWQNINVVSGKTYRLTFDLSGPAQGALVIYGESGTQKEHYYFCKNKNITERHIWNFKPSNTGKGKLYFATKENGTYYYSKISLKIQNVKLFLICLMLSIFLITTSIFLLILSNKSFVLFLSLLILFPVLKINKDEKSIQENRKLTPYQSLILNVNNQLKINNDFGRNFNDWLNDHFCERNLILKIINSLKFIIDQKIDNNYVLQGKDRWLFLKRNIKLLAEDESYYDKIYDDTASAIKRFNNFCNNNNAKLYIVLAPFAEELYCEAIDGINITNKIGRYGKYSSKLSADTGAKIIYGLTALENAKTNGLVYYKTDHHWTQLGAYNVYGKLKESIFDDYNITNTNPTSCKLKKQRCNFGFGETFKRVNNIANFLAKKFYPTNTYYLTSEFNEDYNIVKRKNAILNSNGANKKIFVLGDSYIRNIKNFFGYDFYYTKYYEKQLQIYMPIFEKEILKFKPDIVVLIVYSKNYILIKNWYNDNL